jgi:hypothetical protein
MRQDLAIWIAIYLPIAIGMFTAVWLSLSSSDKDR